MSAYDLTTFGEGQLRLTVPTNNRLLGARHLRVSSAGSEANVAGLLAQLGRSTAWASVLPHGDLGDRVLSEYRAAGVDLGHVRRTETGRVALYFLEPSEAGLPARVRYDREGTAFRDLTPEDLDWDALLDTRLLFVSGITTALTDTTAETVQYAVEEASRRGVDVAVDVNHRELLWSAERAGDTLEPILRNARIVFCARRDADTLFDLDGEAHEVAAALADQLEVPTVVLTDGPGAVTLADRGRTTTADALRVPVVDRPGAGDAFVAGVLHGFLSGDLPRGVACGVRAAAIALTHYGDLTLVRPEDLEVTDTDIIR